MDSIQNAALQIEKALIGLPDTRSVFAERNTGGYFLDFTPNREAAARYGLTVGDVNDVVETAIGGKTITTTVEAREGTREDGCAQSNGCRQRKVQS